MAGTLATFHLTEATPAGGGIGHLACIGIGCARAAVAPSAWRLPLHGTESRHHSKVASRYGRWARPSALEILGPLVQDGQVVAVYEHAIALLARHLDCDLQICQ